MTMQLSHRMHCHLHFLRAIQMRGIDMTPDEIGQLEALLERSRPAYVRPGINRYVLTVRRGRLGQRRLTVVYDIALRCLVTVLPVRPVGGALLNEISRQVEMTR